MMAGKKLEGVGTWGTSEGYFDRYLSIHPQRQVHSSGFCFLVACEGGRPKKGHMLGHLQETNELAVFQKDGKSRLQRSHWTDR